MAIRASFILSMAACVVFLQANACSSSSDDENDDDKSPSGGSSNEGEGSETGKSCSGEVTGCAIGSLTSKQYEDACSVLLSSIDAPAGSKFECEEGPNSGLFLSVNTVAQCVSSRPPTTCKVTVGQLIDCYKAAKNDACDAFDDECTVLFDPGSGCVPKQ